MIPSKRKALAKKASKEALAWLKQIGASIEERLSDTLAVKLAEEEVDLAVTAARIQIADLARSMLRSVAYAVRTGEIPKKFSRDDARGLITTGMKNYDPRVAFQASVRAAYSAGRYERAMRSGMPYLIYRSMRDARVRPEHQKLDGVVQPKGHSFWNTHYPPLGWRCRCKAYPIDDKGLARLRAAGLNVQTTPPRERSVVYRDRLSGETRRLPESVEPGWDYNPRDQGKHLGRMLENRIRLALKKETEGVE